MTDTEKKLYDYGYSVNNELNEEEYKECFDHWLDAVDGCGVVVQDTEYFHKLLDTHIKDWYLW
ncbi:hypothetical protein SIPHO054v2_p0056 [Vibrio phage 103E44.1]|nr:hypothetical protein SIPHO054v2_p0056 [Vibrio phage 103E44.1]QZI87910.1 hypothetical protein SIPHO055v2_p0055 [Vibrio phage 104E43.1]